MNTIMMNTIMNIIIFITIIPKFYQSPPSIYSTYLDVFFSQPSRRATADPPAGHVEGQALHPEVTPRGREDQARLELHPPGTCLDEAG